MHFTTLDENNSEKKKGYLADLYGFSHLIDDGNIYC
jgi:hypothetical protein